MTWFERIMNCQSPDELAGVLLDFTSGGLCVDSDDCWLPGMTCRPCITNWLQEPVHGGAGRDPEPERR